MLSGPSIRAAALSDPGCKRSTNEDMTWFDLNDRGFVLADGMGGERCGDYASELATRAIVNYIKRINSGPEWPFGYDDSLTLSQNLVITAVRVANRAVWKASNGRPECNGMGSTVSLVYFSGEFATIANVGDSRVYLLRSGEFRILTRDDLIVVDMIEAGEITAEAAQTHPLRNVLSQAVGPQEDITVQVVEFTVKRGDRFLLSSDGLHGLVSTDELRRTIADFRDIDEATKALIAAARRNGGPDNISCILIECC